MYNNTIQNVTASNVKCSMEDMEDLMPVFYTIAKQEDAETQAMIFHVYINSDIAAPAYYVTLLELFRTAQEEDEIHLHLNCNGGVLSTAIQVRNAMLKCNCPIFTYANGTVASAATLLWLAGDYIHIEKYTSVMMHYYSGGAVGKGGDMEVLSAHNKLKYGKLFKKAYKYFLTDLEYEKLTNGLDIWFDYKEAKQRMNRHVDAKITKIAKDSLKIYESSKEGQIEELEAKLHSLKTTVMTVADMKTVMLTGQLPMPVSALSEMLDDTPITENITEESVSTDTVDSVGIEQISPPKPKLKRTKKSVE